MTSSAPSRPHPIVPGVSRRSALFSSIGLAGWWLAGPSRAQANRPAAEFRALVTKGTRLSILTDRITRCQVQRLLDVLKAKAERTLAQSVSEARTIEAALRQATGPAPIPALTGLAIKSLSTFTAANEALRSDDKSAIGRLAVVADDAGEAVDKLVAAYVSATSQPMAALLQTTADMQRLTQHLSVHYLLAKAGIDAATQLKEVEVGRRQFVDRFRVLQKAPIKTPRTELALQLIDGQLFFMGKAFDNPGVDLTSLENAVTTSERMLEVLTELYSAYDAAIQNPS